MDLVVKQKYRRLKETLAVLMIFTFFPLNEKLTEI
jgi:hypothetical protein